MAAVSLGWIQTITPSAGVTYAESASQIPSRQKKAAMPAPESAGLIVLGDVDDAADVEQHTFTGWDERSRPLLPHGLGSHFPVFLT